MTNISTVREFLQLEFSEAQEMQLVHAALFLLVYLTDLLRNLLIVAIIVLDRRLHNPIHILRPYDRYAAICLPLSYKFVMGRGVCGKMFFCDVPYLLKITCYEDHIAVDMHGTTGIVLDVVCFILIIVLYLLIFPAVLRMTAAESWAKAFSTCLPRLAIVTVFLSAGVCVHIKPPSDSSLIMDLMCPCPTRWCPPP
ncbi:olfactory receptor 14K1-like [Tachyglossus aculeatus]|uniref:olfactory receptor 14K1-like n=1 Tax=Tachyglossus aculeatus TaxID=9261 RepID=UPI0018F3FC2F|nr:olfactory receptor 14K1-like [Tachyglossus aculeatus]